MGEVVLLHPQGDGCVSGGELPHGSTRVWALELGARAGKKAHFWHRHPNGYSRECDAYVAPAFLFNGQSVLFGPGNYPKCKRCLRRITQS